MATPKSGWLTLAGHWPTLALWLSGSLGFKIINQLRILYECYMFIVLRFSIRERMTLGIPIGILQNPYRMCVEALENLIRILRALLQHHSNTPLQCSARVPLEPIQDSNLNIPWPSYRICIDRIHIYSLYNPYIPLIELL